jgi:hypothetical protein
MAHTTHGHHIPGTPRDEPEEYAKCGGDGICTTCTSEIAGVQGLPMSLKSLLSGAPKDHLAPYVEVTERGYRVSSGREVGDPVDYIAEARRHVRKFIEDHNTSGHDLPKFGLYVPLFAYVLGGWKATVSTDTDDVLPEAYFEVTHRPNGETYVVQYNKFASVTYFD